MNEERILERVNPAGVMRMSVTYKGDEVTKVHTTGFSVVRTDQNEYEVRL